MSCVRAAPTAAPAMRLVTRSTVMAVGNTLVGESGTGQRMDGQLGHSTSLHSSCPSGPIHGCPPYFRSSPSIIDLYPLLQVPSPVSLILPYFLNPTYTALGTRHHYTFRPTSRVPSNSQIPPELPSQSSPYTPSQILSISLGTSHFLSHTLPSKLYSFPAKAPPYFLSPVPTTQASSSGPPFTLLPEATS